VEVSAGGAGNLLETGGRRHLKRENHLIREREGGDSISDEGERHLAMKVYSGPRYSMGTAKEVAESVEIGQ